MAYRFLLAIHDNDGTIPMAGTNNREPLTGITTLQGAYFYPVLQMKEIQPRDA